MHCHNDKCTAASWASLTDFGTLPWFRFAYKRTVGTAGAPCSDEAANGEFTIQLFEKKEEETFEGAVAKAWCRMSRLSRC